MAGENILFNSTGLSEGVIEGALAGLAVTALILGFLFLIAIYVYSALAYQTIYRKSGHKRPWMAWIPIANAVPTLELGGFHWAWVFLAVAAMIPVVGFIASIALVVLIIVSMWRIFEKAGYAGALSLLIMIPIANLIILGIVAWQKKTYKKIKKKK